MQGHGGLSRRLEPLSKEQRDEMAVRGPEMARRPLPGACSECLVLGQRQRYKEGL